VGKFSVFCFPVLRALAGRDTADDPEKKCYTMVAAVFDYGWHHIACCFRYRTMGKSGETYLQDTWGNKVVVLIVSFGYKPYHLFPVEVSVGTGLLPTHVNTFPVTKLFQP
jgi:hypothetical protein